MSIKFKYFLPCNFKSNFPYTHNISDKGCAQVPSCKHVPPPYTLPVLIDDFDPPPTPIPVLIDDFDPPPTPVPVLIDDFDPLTPVRWFPPEFLEGGFGAR